MGNVKVGGVLDGKMVGVLGRDGVGGDDVEAVGDVGGREEGIEEGGGGGGEGGADETDVERKLDGEGEEGGD